MTPAAAVPQDPGRPRGGSLAWRLGLLLGGIVLAVLIVTGLVVNRVVSSSFESVLASQQQQRVNTAADALVDALSAPARLARIRVQAQRLAATLGGQVSIQGPNGGTLLTVGHVPAGETLALQAPIVADSGQVGTLSAIVPSTGTDPSFLRLFNLTLVAAGILSVAGIVLLAVYGTSRLIRPLRTVADAAQRLGSGDLAARAQGGGDRESAELADAFNRMADRLQRSEMLRRRAASDAAHDLATPATVLESQLQAMVDGVLPADREQLEAARSAAGALGSVIGQMGELASAEASELQRRIERVEVGSVIAETTRALDPLFRERAVSLDVEAGPQLFAAVDASQLGRALRNVVANAAQHAPGGTSVGVGMAATPSAVQIRVSDRGPGIAAEDVPHVFERFYRADRSRTSSDGGADRHGSGIGLTIARELLAANGGRIAVERTGPGGTTFLIEVPRIS